MVRVLHAADFHLDSAFTALTAEQARQRRQEGRDLVRHMVDYGNDHQADLMLLCGDLFDSDALFAQTPQELSEALASFRGRVFIAPGNHDYYSDRSPYATDWWPENVHIFTSRTMERVFLPKYGCTVYGAAFLEPEENSSAQLSGLAAEEEEDIAIGLLHGEVGVRDSRYRAIPLTEIENSGLTYLALGHVHSHGGIRRAGNTTYAYSGCTEGRGFDETGPRGFLFGQIEKGAVQMEFVPFARRRYELLSVDVTDCDVPAAVESAAGTDTERDIYRILLTGEREGSLDMDSLYHRLSPMFYALELQDRTTVRRQLWDRCGEDTLRGLFLQKMKERHDAAANDEERAVIQQAVGFALDAMDNRE